MAAPRYQVGNTQFVDSDQGVHIDTLRISSPTDIVVDLDSQQVAENHQIGTVAGYFSGAYKTPEIAYNPPYTNQIAPEPTAGPSPNYRWILPNEYTYVEKFAFGSTLTSAEVGTLSQPAFSYYRSHGLSSQTHGYVTAKSFAFGNSPSTYPIPFQGIPNAPVNWRSTDNPYPTAPTDVKTDLVGTTATDIERFQFSNRVTSKSVGDLSAPGGGYAQQPSTYLPYAPTLKATHPFFIRGATTHSSESHGYVNIEAMQNPAPGAGRFYWITAETEIVRYPFAMQDGVATEVYQYPSAPGWNRIGQTGFSSPERGYMAAYNLLPQPIANGYDPSPNYYAGYFPYETYPKGFFNLDHHPSPAYTGVASFPFAVVPAFVSSLSDLDHGGDGFSGGVQTREYGYMLSNNPDGSTMQKFPFAIPFAVSDVSPVIPFPGTPLEGLKRWAAGYGRHREQPSISRYSGLNTTQDDTAAYIEGLPYGAPGDPISSDYWTPYDHNNMFKFGFASEGVSTTLGSLINNDWGASTGQVLGDRGSSINAKATNQD